MSHGLLFITLCVKFRTLYQLLFEFQFLESQQTIWNANSVGAWWWSWRRRTVLRWTKRCHYSLSVAVWKLFRMSSWRLLAQSRFVANWNWIVLWIGYISGTVVLEWVEWPWLCDWIEHRCLCIEQWLHNSHTQTCTYTVLTHTHTPSLLHYYNRRYPSHGVIPSISRVFLCSNTIFPKWLSFHTFL